MSDQPQERTSGSSGPASAPLAAPSAQRSRSNSTNESYPTPTAASTRSRRGTQGTQEATEPEEMEVDNTPEPTAGVAELEARDRELEAREAVLLRKEMLDYIAARAGLGDKMTDYDTLMSVPQATRYIAEFLVQRVPRTRPSGKAGPRASPRTSRPKGPGDRR
ncbi:hypothetical protein BO78DRAFT_396006 [Aspergillus sclerotiicarbonarius CBS 121057]|uniref:Uncharacterized protein n=1 Tax=Aspergillus sclerotiicarbonarius (strain CBS 121057 / IBT 28362) TaxID=1448318 RepID=A0A319EKG6_ASPSB|nr:hypothetical protein BO78DRAFT_396006 [Aspergillus sclerotiicarbonarius CBS 121057]